MSRRRGRSRTAMPDQLVKPKAEQLFNPYQPVAALGGEALDLIHDGSMRILEEIGLEVLNERRSDCTNRMVRASTGICSGFTSTAKN